MISGDYKKKYSFEERKSNTQKQLDLYPDQIPTIVELENEKTFPQIDFGHSKFLFPSDMTLGQSLYIFRGRFKLDKSEALYLFINNELIPSTRSMAEIYVEHKDEDGLLYIVIGQEKTFGTI